MRFLVVLVPLLLALVSASPQAIPALLEKRGCNANNCARAVTGTRPGKLPDVTSRLADCVSFQLTTVYTCDWLGGAVVGGATPTAVPTYASDCTTSSPQSAYASACSCWGIPSCVTTTEVPWTGP